MWFRDVQRSKYYFCLAIHRTMKWVFNTWNISFNDFWFGMFTNALIKIITRINTNLAILFYRMKLGSWYRLQIQRKDRVNNSGWSSIVGRVVCNWRQFVHGILFIFIISIMGVDEIRDLKVWSRKRHIVEEKVYMFWNVVNKE